MLEDSAVRERALDPTASFIVQAPAGSGKTELLIQRYMRLLERVETPEAIVAITFTRKAAAEMRSRVVERMPALPVSSINIQTIDALCANIVRQMPWLARFGALPEITEKAQDLYREAARNTLRKLGEEERTREIGPISTLVLHLDNDFNSAERLLAEMLEKRDQWLRHTVHADVDDLRQELESNLQAQILIVLRRLCDCLSRDLRAQAVALARHASLCDPELAETGLEPDARVEDLPRWQAIGEILLTDRHEWRRTVDKRMGFMPGSAAKDRHARLIEKLRPDCNLLEALRALRLLPSPTYDESQWATMKALLTILGQAAAELEVVFQERGRIDFAHLSIGALRALGPDGNPTDLALALGHRFEHILVDEFQDTSYTQYELLQRLTAGWDPGDGRTLFVVGDPMQSIYRFRQAEVSLFLKAQREGIGSVKLEPLTLRVNFRSDSEIVDWVNETFAGVLPAEDDVDNGAVKYTSSAAHRSSPGAGPVVHPFLGDEPVEEGARVAGLIEKAAGQRVGVLVRARSHLVATLSALKQRGIRYQAIEIDQLAERPAIQDLMALTFAILHLADRISWLAILRAPWCGLTLEDLHAIAGHDGKSTVWELLRRPDVPLTGDGEIRVRRFVPVLARAIENRGRGTLRRLIEETWLMLGGPACVRDDTDLEDAAAYFDLLEGLEQAGDLADFDTLRQQVSELFAQPDTSAPETLQVMTIHKAKGLQFDTVILPGLGQRPRPDEPVLLAWIEQEGRLFLAPISQTRQDKDPIYTYVAHIDRQRSKHETARLLYVAATRARTSLHLLGNARVTEKGEIVPASGSFLQLLWPTVHQHFENPEQPSRVAANTPVVVSHSIRRLPANWLLPAPPPPVTWKRSGVEQIEPPPEIVYEWVGDTLRHAGTVLHGLLQRVASDGLERWNTPRVTSQRAIVQTLLRGLGVAPAEMEEACRRVENGLRQALTDERGRWLLSAHEAAESEHSVTGLIDGKLYQAVIDRTFISDGTRWIVDYKTSFHEGGDLEGFLDKEQHRYREQLERYARLMRQQDLDRPIRLGLYFPLLNGWREWTAPGAVLKQASLFG